MKSKPRHLNYGRDLLLVRWLACCNRGSVQGKIRPYDTIRKEKKERIDSQLRATVPTIGQERGWLKRAGGRERAAVREEEGDGGEQLGFSVRRRGGRA